MLNAFTVVVLAAVAFEPALVFWLKTRQIQCVVANPMGPRPANAYGHASCADWVSRGRRDHNVGMASGVTVGVLQATAWPLGGSGKSPTGRGSRGSICILANRGKQRPARVRASRWTARMCLHASRIETRLVAVANHPGVNPTAERRSCIERRRSTRSQTAQNITTPDAAVHETQSGHRDDR